MAHDRSSPVALGVANDLYEPDVARTVSDFHAAGLCDYLVVYVYDNYTPEFMTQMRRALPSTLKYMWHTSGDFELPYDGPNITANWPRIQQILDLWQPSWATEDIVLTHFARTRTLGEPNYVQPFLTEGCLDACIRRQRQVAERMSVPLYPEIPHFYMPGPEEMNVSTFFRRFVDATGATLNFDVGHFFSYNLLHRRAPMDGIDEFPFDAVGEIHTAGGMVGDADGVTWIDDYAGPLNPLTEEALAYVIPRCPNLHAMYTETIGAEPWVVRYNLERLAALLPTSARSNAAVSDGGASRP